MSWSRAFTAFVLALIAGATVRGVVASPNDAPPGETPGDANGPPAVAEAGAPAERRELGIGEDVYLVVGGVFDRKEEAEEANARLSFGELQGFYVAPIAQFRDLERFLQAEKGDWILVSAFRTQEGAQGFLALGQAAGAAALITPPVENRGYLFVGLGQEPAPDGSGPLREPQPEEQATAASASGGRQSATQANGGPGE